MASIKISDLTNTETLTRDDVIPVVNGDETKKISIANLSKNLAEFGEIGFKPVVVDTLPTEDIKTNTIYLTPSEDPDDTNTYDEWIYSNETWEKIGTTGVDLSGYYTKEETTDAILSELADSGFIILDLDMEDCGWDTTTKTANNVTYASRISSRGYNEAAIQETIAKINSKISYLSTIYTEDEILSRFIIVLRNIYYNSNNVTVDGTHIIFSDKNGSIKSTPRGFTGELFDATTMYTNKSQLGFGLTGCFEVNVSTNSADMTNYVTNLAIYINVSTNYDVGQSNAAAQKYDVYKNKLDFSKYTYQYVVDNNVLGETSSYYATPIDNVTFGDTAKMLEFWLTNGYTGYGKTGMMVYISRNKNFIAPTGVWYTTLASETDTRTYGSWSLEKTADVHIGFSKTTTEEQYTEFMENLQIMIADATAPIGSYSPYLDGEIATKKYVDDASDSITFNTSQYISISDDKSYTLTDIDTEKLLDFLNTGDLTKTIHLRTNINSTSQVVYSFKMYSNDPDYNRYLYKTHNIYNSSKVAYYGVYLRLEPSGEPGNYTACRPVVQTQYLGTLYKSTQILSTDNRTSYTPTADYHPATKKYVDDSIKTAITDALGGEY